MGTSDLVATSPELVCPLLNGVKIPQVSAKTADGTPFELMAAIQTMPAVLVFYRGGWWPHCNRQLVQLRDTQSQFSSLGFQIIAVSPDQPAKVREAIKKHKITFSLFSDSQMTASRAFRIAYRWMMPC
jgi:peroxiredoxin